LEDKRNSVYSPRAALQRKIEIIAVTSEDVEVSSFSNDTIQNAVLSVSQKKYSFGDSGQLKIPVENTGNQPLLIFNVVIRCEGCVELSFPESEIPPGEKVEIIFTKNANFPPQGVDIEIISNAVPSREYIHINP